MGGGWLVVLGFVAKEFIVDVFMGALDDLYGSSAQWHCQNRGKMPPGKRAAITLSHWVSEPPSWTHHEPRARYPKRVGFSYQYPRAGTYLKYGHY